MNLDRAVLSAYLAAVDDFNPMILERAVSALIAEAGEFAPPAGRLQQECNRVLAAEREKRGLPRPGTGDRWFDRCRRLGIEPATMSSIGVTRWRAVMDCHERLSDAEIRDAFRQLELGRAFVPPLPDDRLTAREQGEFYAALATLRSSPGLPGRDHLLAIGETIARRYGGTGATA